MGRRTREGRCRGGDKEGRGPEHGWDKEGLQVMLLTVFAPLPQRQTTCQAGTAQYLLVSLPSPLFDTVGIEPMTVA